MSPTPPDSSARPADWEAFYRDYRKPGYVDGFEITTKLGGGMFGLVFRARRMSIGKDYAIKFLQVDDTEVRRAVLSELEQVKFFAQIDHPNLVSIEDRGEVDGIPYLVMAFAGTDTLRDKMVAGRAPTAVEKDDLLRWFLQACRGLAALHERSLVHFDIKPANVFLKGAVARLGDYGLSKLVTHSRGSLSMGRGTPYYMAPEMLQRRGDHRSDIYSLGVMLYELLCGQVPFTGDSEWEVLKKHETTPPDCPAFLTTREREVLQRCLQKDPAARFQSVHDLLMAFGAVASVGAAAWTELRVGASEGAGPSVHAAKASPKPTVGIAAEPTVGPTVEPPPLGDDPYSEFGKASREALKHANVIARRAARKASVVMREAMHKSHGRTLRRWAAWRERRQARRLQRQLRRDQRTGSWKMFFAVPLTLLGVMGAAALGMMVLTPHSMEPSVAVSSGSLAGTMHSTFEIPPAFVGDVSTSIPDWVRSADHDRSLAREQLVQRIERLREVAPLSDKDRMQHGPLPVFQLSPAFVQPLQQADLQLDALMPTKSYPGDVGNDLAQHGAIMLRAAAQRLARGTWVTAGDVEAARRLHRFLVDATGCKDIRWLEPMSDTPAKQGKANRDLGPLWIWFVNEFAPTERAWSTFRSLLKQR